MTIYFAGSIRGGRDDRKIYADIIALLRDYGTVVTEHVGDADVLVAEVTAPSLGVGYEIVRSVEWGKRILCLYRPGNGHKLSGMIAGCDALTVREYSRVDELRAVFDEELRQ